METLTIKFLNEHYEKDSDIENLIAYITGHGKNKHKESVYKTGTKYLPKNYRAATREIILTQRIFNKARQRRLYHVIVSFPASIKDIKTIAACATEIADILGEEYQLIYGIHTSTPNKHIHYAFSSVKFENGQKFHQSKAENKIMKNKILAKVNLILKKNSKHNYPMLTLKGSKKIDCKTQ